MICDTGPPSGLLTPKTVPAYCTVVSAYNSFAPTAPSGVVLVTHNVRHAMAIGDRFTILNHGRTLGTALRGEISQEELQNMMAGGQELVQLEESLQGMV
jgi:ABC-type sugar transport system ATPase subunit